MAIQKLENVNAFSSGAQLWIVADQDSSKWARQVDWEVGFQLSRADRKKTPACSIPLTKIAEACEFEIPKIKIDKDVSTMIASGPYLPNVYTIKIPFTGDKVEWLNHASKVWQGLTCPSVRLFLPDKMTFDEFKKGWQSQETANDISVVMN